MATWKKVIVSGSQAELAALKVDNLTSGQAVIGGGSAANLSTRVISGSGAILASGGTNIVLSGSFSGSFQGNGSGLTGVSATTSNALTAGEGISTFTFNGSAAQTVSVSGAADLTSNIITKWDNNANKFTNSSLTDNGTTISGTTSIVLSGANSSLTGSLRGTASYANNSDQVKSSLTAGNGLTGTTFNGSAASTFDVGQGALITVTADAVQVATSSLTTNQIPKYSANTFAGSNISDTGTQVQIGSSATSGLSIAAGGVTVTGNSTFNNNLTVAGDLTVAGTASFQNTQNLLIGDRFAAFASGSTSLTDGGIIVVSSTSAAGMSGSAWFLESVDAGTYGRFAVQYNVHTSASSVAADEYAVTVKISPSTNPSAAPVWGGANNGSGNMWINNTSGDIFIYA
jgi:filamentous hemagglutinin